MRVVHDYDEFTDRMARSVFKYTQDRLRLNPVPIDHSVAPDELEERAGNLLNANGNDPEEVLRRRYQRWKDDPAATVPEPQLVLFRSLVEQLHDQPTSQAAIPDRRLTEAGGLP